MSALHLQGLQLPPDSSDQFREPGARRRIGVCMDVLVRRFLLAAGVVALISRVSGASGSPRISVPRSLGSSQRGV